MLTTQSIRLLILAGYWVSYCNKLPLRTGIHETAGINYVLYLFQNQLHWKLIIADWKIINNLLFKNGVINVHLLGSMRFELCG
jgi:hypothetical protein